LALPDRVGWDSCGLAIVLLDGLHNRNDRGGDFGPCPTADV
jgi:hypothetical protein